MIKNAKIIDKYIFVDLFVQFLLLQEVIKIYTYIFQTSILIEDYKRQNFFYYLIIFQIFSLFHWVQKEKREPKRIKFALTICVYFIIFAITNSFLNGYWTKIMKELIPTLFIGKYFLITVYDSIVFLIKKE